MVIVHTRLKKKEKKIVDGNDVNFIDFVECYSL